MPGKFLPLLLILLAPLLISGCSTPTDHRNFAALYGPSLPTQRQLSEAQYQRALKRGEVSYSEAVKPILDSRCVVCHGCYDAPCQLKLTSAEGLDRGATKQIIYEPYLRKKAIPPTRLFIDAQTTPRQWRKKEFYPVLNERSNLNNGNLNNSLLALLLNLKRDYPQPESGKLPDTFKFGLDRELECPTMDEFEKYSQAHPEWGMPYAMPGLSDREHTILTRWLEQGAKVPPEKPLSEEVRQTIKQWETFFNGESLKQRLVSRYIYEHLFIGHLYFSGAPVGEFYHLVRSTTPPGQPINEIATLRPYDDPGSAPFYYRIRPITSTIVDKNHFVYPLSPARMARFRELFIAPDYAVDEFPSYETNLASNPFKTYAALPVKSRYQFLLDDAEYFISGFIKGPVCRGQIALSVIRDRFWVAFFDPELMAMKKSAEFLVDNSHFLELPANAGDNAGLLAWRKYDRLAEQYQQKKEQLIREHFAADEGPGMDLIWDGNGNNRNAALTIFRHFDSATVVKGFVGDTPLTGWVMGYPTFERLHYLLVAGFNIYSDTGQQLATRLYMDFLRQEAENDFLRFMPADQRAVIRASWYRGASAKISEFFSDAPDEDALNRPSGVVYHTDQPVKEFFQQVTKRLGEAAGPRDQLNQCSEPPCRRAGASADEEKIENQLQKITRLKGETIQALPEVTFIQVTTGNSDQPLLAYTLLRNKMLANVSFMIGESLRQEPDKDTMTLVPGFLGSYPNLFFAVQVEQLADFVSLIKQSKDKDVAEKLYSRYAVRRSNPKIWKFSDWFNAEYKKQQPIQAGWFDMSRYQNR